MANVELLSPEGLRVDGRRAHELRKISASTGVFDQADGSAYVAHGNTKAIATVYGPREAPRDRMNPTRATVKCELSTAPFSTGERKQRSKGDRRTLEFEALLEKALSASIMVDLYPRSTISVFVQVVQSDGGYRSACINAASLALVDAGIPMRDFVCACSVACVDTTPILDINYVEESVGAPELTIAMLPRSEKLVALELDSRLHVDKFDGLLALAMQGSGQVFRTLKDVVVRDCAALLKNVS